MVDDEKGDRRSFRMDLMARCRVERLVLKYLNPQMLGIC